MPDLSKLGVSMAEATQGVPYLQAALQKMASEPGATEAATVTDRWTLTLQDPDDPYGHSARAQQRTTTLWDVEYYRGEELDSTGCVGTAPPHAPPVAILMSTLKGLRVEADYWASQGGEAAL